MLTDNPTCHDCRRIYDLVREKLTHSNDPGDLLQALDDMFNAWVGSDYSTGTTADDRATVLNAYRSLHGFISATAA